MSPAPRRPALPPPTAAKAQRWLDIIAALLRRRTPVTFEELARDVPAYHARWTEHRAAKRLQESALSRLFERDKKELRAFGVEIVVDKDETGTKRLYTLAARDFYLPFVACVGQASGPLSPTPAARRRAERTRGLPTVAFPPDELHVMLRATRRVAQLGDPGLTDAARRALQRLSHDLAALTPEHDAGETVVVPVLEAAVMRALGEAVANAQAVTMTYRSIGRDDQRERTIEPLGLAFIGGHWYCVARDPGSEVVKMFRASRMRGVRRTGREGAVQPPPGFVLDAHATSRPAWALGDGEARHVIVRPASACDLAALGGTPVGRGRRDRAFEVRRLDPFLRWVLTFAGDARVVGPKDAVQSWRQLLAVTIAHHEATP